MKTAFLAPIQRRHAPEEKREGDADELDEDERRDQMLLGNADLRPVPPTPSG